jgi:hypothetical protein
MPIFQLYFELRRGQSFRDSALHRNFFFFFTHFYSVLNSLSDAGFSDVVSVYGLFSSWQSGALRSWIQTNVFFERLSIYRFSTLFCEIGQTIFAVIHWGVKRLWSKKNLLFDL